MRRPALLSLCLLAILAPSARAAAIDFTSRADYPSGIATINPVFTADGGLVFGTAPTRKRVIVWRLDAGASEPRAILTLNQPDPATYYSIYARLIPAGPGGGFLLDRFDGRGEHGGVVSYANLSLTLYRVPGEGGVALPDCDWGCFSCGPAFPAEVATDTNSVLIAPTCGTGDQPDPFVYDIATGSKHDVSSLPSNAHIAGSFVSGTYPYSDGGGVFDWTTGRLVRSAIGMTTHALLPDGTLYYLSLIHI